MTQWNPVWLVEIDGVEYTDAVLANLTIRSGRTNIYEQAQAGYVNLQLLDVSQTTVPVSINSTVSVSIKNTSNTFVPIFGGNVVDIGYTKLRSKLPKFDHRQNREQGFGCGLLSANVPMPPMR